MNPLPRAVRQLLAAALSAGLDLGPPRPPPEVTHCYDAVVVRVHDGDTPFVDVSIGWGLWMHEQPVRLVDCHAPELRDPGGQASARSLEELLDADPRAPGFQPGKPVILRSVKREKYGRLLGWIYADGVDVGAEQARRRHARKEPP